MELLQCKALIYFIWPNKACWSATAPTCSLMMHADELGLVIDEEACMLDPVCGMDESQPSLFGYL